MDATKLVAWLRFDESTTADKCGNSWTAYGSPTIENGALQIANSSQYVKLADSIYLGGQDFTVATKIYVDSSAGNLGALFTLYQGTTRFISLFVESSTRFSVREKEQTKQFNLSKNQWHYVELDYQHSEGTLKCYVDGTLAATISGTLTRTELSFVALGTGTWSGSEKFIGSLDEFMIYDGVALHSENFTPPTSADYAKIFLGTFDVERKLSNVVEFTADVERTVIAAWRYFNAGTADTLTVTGTTLADLPETKSVTGTAFYQTTRAKCFDLPSTAEIWIKFDVYFDGSNRWRAYNGGANGTTGITAQTDGRLSFFSNNTNGGDFSGVCKKNQLQTVLLHMVCGTSAGVVEAWVDGTKIYAYTGDVNHGEDFADIYLQSDDAGTFFSNVIISNREIGLNDGYISFTADVQRKLSNIVEFTADVQRGIMEVINVPFIFGDHFNHCCSVEYDAPTTSIGRPLKIKLPNKSKAYVHATALNGGAFKVFSDTDAVGTVTGDVYAALDECESVFVQKVVAPQSILYMFLNSLRYRGGSALDSAIENCTYGVFPSKDELVNSFLNDLDNSESNLDFLSRCCGVDLSNDDTGAVIGSDAGGGYPKTAKSIVPEPVPVEDWIVPEKGSSKTIAGLTVYFPTSGYKGTLTDAENHILAGLNSVWIEQALLLIQRSCNIDFRTNQTNIVHDISVKFVDENNDALAYVSITTKDGSTTSLELRVNMRRYSGINMTSEDGAAGSNTYLDRVLAHEMTHAVMAARIKNYTELPRFLREGIAEFIHGIDDERKSDIQYLTQTAQRNTLQSIFSTGGDSGDINIYSAGYLFFRYMIKQTLEKGTFPLERYSSTGHIRLFISDGAIDYYGNALTDNTRATLTADTLRELVKSTSLTADVEIFDTIQIEFDSDINRAIKGKVKLFAIDTSEYFSGGGLSSSGDSAETLTPTVIPSQEIIPAAPDNTIGLQSIEISLGEQQLTDNVSFVGVVPFDIMFPVQGQYLDYVFDMRVERVQQRGVLYTCDCCVDVDQLLYTQIAYTVPPNEFWHKLNDEFYQKTKTAKEEWQKIWRAQGVPAYTHAQKIAASLRKSPVIQFNNFPSTVFAEDKAGATYADLIRDVFGWSSRVPTHMINVFIRNDKIYFVQRGHEAHLLDLTGTKHTIPIVTHELVRMTWGSTPWSKTETKTTRTYNPNYDWNGEPTAPQFPKNSNEVEDLSDNPQYDFPENEGTKDKDDDNDNDNPHNPSAQEKETETIQGDVRIVTTFEYTEGGQISKTETTVYKKGQEQSRTTVTRSYTTLQNGQVFLSKETKIEYEWEEAGGIQLLGGWKEVDRIVTQHTPAMQGQAHVVSADSDGNVIGEDVGQNTGDDRVTPNQTWVWLGRARLAGRADAMLAYGRTLTKTRAALSDSGDQETLTAFDKEFPEIATGEWENVEWERTLYGLSLYDSSFPITDETENGIAKLAELTEAVSWLNRRTKETVTMTIYEYPHLIDFNDRILFNGAQYFLVSNVAMTNARVFNEQRVTFTRWY